MLNLGYSYLPCKSNFPVWLYQPCGHEQHKILLKNHPFSCLNLVYFFVCKTTSFEQNTILNLQLTANKGY